MFDIIATIATQTDPGPIIDAIIEQIKRQTLEAVIAAALGQ